jgi:hypothetical protein
VDFDSRRQGVHSEGEVKSQVLVELNEVLIIDLSQPGTDLLVGNRSHLFGLRFQVAIEARHASRE